MKTKLLYLASVMLVFITSCSVEENTQLSDQEKDQKVKSLVKIFAEEVQPSDSYKKFIEDVKLRSKSTSQYTQEDLEQEFLDQQSAEFVELYYFVASLQLSEEEIENIVVQYFAITSDSKELRSKTDNDNGDNSDDNDNDNEECGIGQDQGDDSLLALIVRIICEVRRDTIIN